MSNNGIVNIHGKDYYTVAKRVEMAHEAKTFEKLFTEVLSHNPVVVRATVTIKGKEFTGISSVSLDAQRVIEKTNPYEVAETSAVGRALGFAGYGIEGSVASADEVTQAVQVEEAIAAKPKTPAKPYRADRFYREPEGSSAAEDDYEPPQELEGAAGGQQDAPLPLGTLQDAHKCRLHGMPMHQGKSKTKVNNDGTPKTYLYHDSNDGQRCFGRGYESRR